MNLLVSRRSYLLAPTLFLMGTVLLFMVWQMLTPTQLRAAFDAEGHSFFELLTVSVYALIVPAVWLCCPFSGSFKRKFALSAAVSCVAVMAVCKQLDLHEAALTALYPDVVKSFKGTPFKMRFLTAGHVPLGAKSVSLLYFVLFFGVFAALLAYYAKHLIKGFFRFHPVSWTVAFFGASGVLVAVCDRLPAWYRHIKGLGKNEVIGTSFASFCTCYEEGLEMFIALFALLAILQAHALYAPERPYEKHLEI